MSNRARKGTRVKLTRERDAVLNKDDDQALRLPLIQVRNIKTEVVEE